MKLSIVSLIIAAYAAILSTLNYLAQRREKQSRITVTLNSGIMGVAPGIASDGCLFIEANNPAHKAVVVTVPGLLLPDGREMVFLHPESNVRFPFKLEPEHQCVVWTDLKKLGSQLRSEGFGGVIEIIGVYKDAVGRKHESKPYKFNVDVWGA